MIRDDLGRQMVRVVSLEQAIAQGDTPAELLAIAKWHEDRLVELERSKKARKKDYNSAARHLDTAEALRAVAAQLAEVQQKVAA